LAILAALLLMSCAPLRPLAPPQQKSVSHSSSALVNWDGSQNITGISAWDNVLYPWLGTPYLSGGNTKKGTDCSGFVSSVYMEKERMSLPRTTTDGFKKGKSVNKDNLAVGDLIYFGEKGRASHVGLFVGNGNFIHASSSQGVMISPLEDNYWKPKYMGARRLL
jgi:cell wall-associated NlpC family hydrolase